MSVNGRLGQVPGGLLQPAQVQHGWSQEAEEAEGQEGDPGLGGRGPAENIVL